MSEFLNFLAPPGKALANYDATKLYTEQPEGIPEVFLQAMDIRTEVYVNEQHVPLENEFDEDDHKSYHWVAYASVGSPSIGAKETGEQQGERQDGASNQAQEQQSQGRKTSTANKVPVGTIRLVPPPHAPHPEHEGGSTLDNKAADVQHERGAEEPYIKLGRLAVLKPYRGVVLEHARSVEVITDT